MTFGGFRTKLILHKYSSVALKRSKVKSLKSSISFEQILVKESSEMEYKTVENTTFENTFFGNRTFQIVTLFDSKENTTITNHSLSITAKAFIFIYILIFTIGIIGNVITCIVIAKMKTMHTPTNFYLFSLAISDMIFLMIRVHFQVNVLLSSEWSSIISSVLLFINETATNATVLTTTAFTVERYLAICHPFFTRNSMSELSRVVKFIMGIWIISFLFSALPAWCFSNDFAFRNSPLWYTKHVIVTSVVLFFVIPFSLIIVLYILIGSALRKYEREKNITTTVSPQDSKVIRMLVAVVVAFFICWTPFCTARLLIVFKLITPEKDKHLFDTINRSVLIMALLSTIINPFIYCTMSTKFRKAFKVIFVRSWLKFGNRHNYSMDSIRTTSFEMSSYKKG